MTQRIEYRIYTQDDRIKFAGTDQPSFFSSLEKAVEACDFDNWEKVYEYCMLTNRRRAEVCVNKSFLKKETYFALYDTQTGRYMASGYNSRTLEDLIEAYKDYVSIDSDDDERQFFKIATTEQMQWAIQENDFSILCQTAPFDKNYHDF